MDDNQIWAGAGRAAGPFLILLIIAIFRWLRRPTDSTPEKAANPRQSLPRVTAPPTEEERQKAEDLRRIAAERQKATNDYLAKEAENFAARDAAYRAAQSRRGNPWKAELETSAEEQERARQKLGAREVGAAEREDRVAPPRERITPERQSYIDKPIPDEIARHMQDWLRGGFSGPDQSPLSYVGYHVGKTAGLSNWARQRRLEVCFRVPIPDMLRADYADWGQPATVQRVKAMAAHVQRHADLRRSEARFDQAVAEWDDDRAWLVRELGAKPRPVRSVSRSSGRSGSGELVNEGSDLAAKRRRFARVPKFGHATSDVIWIRRRVSVFLIFSSHQSNMWHRPIS